MSFHLFQDSRGGWSLSQLSQAERQNRLWTSKSAQDLTKKRSQRITDSLAVKMLFGNAEDLTVLSRNVTNETETRALKNDDKL